MAYFMFDNRVYRVYDFLKDQANLKTLFEMPIIQEGFGMRAESSGDNTQLLSLLPLISRTVLSASSLRESGYTKSQFLIISALSLRDNLTMGQVAGFISSSKEQATRAVAPLVDHGLVERYVDPDNRTKIHIRLTEKGRDYVEQSNRCLVQNLHQTMQEKITVEEMLELKQCVETMIQILSKINEA